jgi:hypothetical protein
MTFKCLKFFEAPGKQGYRARKTTNTSVSPSRALTKVDREFRNPYGMRVYWYTVESNKNAVNFQEFLSSVICKFAEVKSKVDINSAPLNSAVIPVRVGCNLCLEP